MRNVLIEGSEVDATILKRLLRKIFIFASKFWQLHSLYLSNARYQPLWHPRYMAFKGSFFSAAIAAAQLEGYFPIFGKKTNLPAQWMNESHYVESK